MDRRPPNFLVVVFDALRASDFPGGWDAVDQMPFVRSLQKSAWVFPNAVTPASWTVPSHASLLTGLYPWEHGAHGQASITLAPSVPRLSSLLRKEGYRSGLFAANGFLAPPYGLAEGFDTVAWGGWWERYLRVPTSVAPFEQVDGEERASGAWAARMGGVRRRESSLLVRATHHLDRYPWVSDTAGRLALQLRAPGSPRDVRISTWIEPRLEQWISGLPKTTPFFALLNIQDTHDPFFPGPEQATGLRDRWALLRVRQDLLGALVGRWTPTTEELRVLHELYRWTVRRLDGRVRRLVEILQATQRWDNTWLILTSDHGQAFGEEGYYLHYCGISEGIQRIPLWVRPPGGEAGASRTRGLASLVDLAPLVLRESGSRATVTTSGANLRELRDHERPGPVLSVNDGLFWEHMVRWAGPAARHRLSRSQVAAYQGDMRWTVTSPGDQIEAVRLPPGMGDPEPGSAPPSPEAVALARRGLEGLRSVQTERGPEIDRRLRSWGYV